MARDKFLTFVAPSNPHFSCNWKGLNVPNLNGCFFWRPTATTRKKQLWSWGARGIPRLNLLFYRVAVFYEEPGLKRRALSVSASATFSYAQDIGWHWRMQNIMAAIWITNWIRKKFRWYLCGRCSTLGCMLLFCVAGAGLRKYDGCVAWPCHATHMQHTRNTQSTQHATRALFLFCVAGSMMAVLRGPAMQLTCNTHATHSQHNTQHEHFSCKFSMNVRISRGLPRIRSLNANIRFLAHDAHFDWEFTGKVLVLRVVLTVCCMWVAWQGHATQPSYFQSPAPATQKSSMHPKVLHLATQIPSELFFYPICN